MSGVHPIFEPILAAISKPLQSVERARADAIAAAASQPAHVCGNVCDDRCAGHCPFYSAGPQLPDLASQEEVAKTAARIAMYEQARHTRLGEMTLAREVRTRHGIRTSWELHTELTSLVASFLPVCGYPLDEYRDKLRALAEELFEELTAPPPEVEEYGTDKRGELDGFTVGVYGRAYE